MLAKRRKNIGINNIFHRNAGVVFLIVAVALICAMTVVSFAACNKKDGGSSGNETPPEIETPPEEESPPSDDEGGSKLKKFENIIYEDSFVTYDGNAHVIEAQGLPFGTTVEYSLKDCVDVGEYSLTATFKLVGYETLSLTAVLTILPAKADIAFEDAAFVWDGLPHSIYVKGYLPSDAVVKYDGNECVEVGEHTVTAHVTLNKNYLPVDDLTAKLTITEKQYTISFVHWDGHVETRKVYRGHSLPSEEIPTNKDRDGFYQMIWDPEDLAQLENVYSDLTVCEINGGIKRYEAIFDPNGGVLESRKDLVKTTDGKWMLYYTVLDDIELPTPFQYDDVAVFVGWYDEEGRLVTRLPDGAGLRNMVLTAKWENTPTAVNFARNGARFAQNITRRASLFDR